MDCVDENTLVEFVERVLTPARRSDVEQHIDGCDVCRQAIAGFVGVPAVEGTNVTQIISRSGVLQPGTRVDHFQVLRLIGRGGMGEVYLARDTKLGRRVALKVVRRNLQTSAEALERIRLEARTTARFSHPNIVTVHAVGEFAGAPYVALEYVEGQTLRERIRERALGLQEVLRIGSVIAEALDVAHQNGVWHRDLKPDNIQIGDDGRLRVLDFGLAELADGRTASPDGPIPDSSQTPLRGTPGYMAPEQWHGVGVGAAVDIWALGVILFRLIAGRRPFDAQTVIGQREMVCGPDPAPRLSRDVHPELTDRIIDLVARCLDKRPEQRPVAAAVANTLHELLTARQRRVGNDESPFRGLAPFLEHHADMFHGRNDDVAALVERIRAQPILPIVGPSGAGKSSFMHAGLVPRLREQSDWIVLTMRPGADPFAALASTVLQATDSGPVDLLRSNELSNELQSTEGRLGLVLRVLSETHGQPVLLLVDQLEELFTLVTNETVRRSFLAALGSAADEPVDPVRVVLTIRDDFLGRLAASEPGAMIASHVAVLHRPDASALEELLTAPLAAVGYAYDDPTLVTDMIREVAEEPVCLPLLSFAADRLWRGRDRDRQRLLRAEFDRIGGVGGALARHADSVLDGFSPVQLATARDLLLRLVTPQRTRRTVDRAALIEGLEGGESVLQRLEHARLVTTAASDPGREAQFELTHESLVRSWRRLARWIDENHDELAYLYEVREAADLWQRRGETPDEVWAGDTLRDAERRIERAMTEVPVVVRRFIEAGRRAGQRRARRRRLLLVAAGVALIAGVAMLAEQTRRATTGERTATRLRAEAELEGAKKALTQLDLLEARAKLRTSLEIEDSTLARGLWWQLSDNPTIWSLRVTYLYDGAFDPRGGEVALASNDTTLHVVDLVTTEARLFRGHTDKILAVVYADDGTRIASASWGGRIIIWDSATGDAVTKIDSNDDGIRGLSFSSDGTLIAGASNDGSVRVFDTRSGTAVTTLRDGDSRVLTVRFAPDGERLVSGSSDGLVRLWSLQASAPLRTLRGHEGGVTAIAFDRAGRMVTGGRGGTIIVWSADEFEPQFKLQVPEQGVLSLDLTSDDRIVIANSDRRIRVWNPGEPHANVVQESGGRLTWVRVDPKVPGRLAFASAGRLHLVAIEPPSELRTLTQHAGGRGIDFSTDGRRIAASAVPGHILEFDARDGTVLRTFAQTAGAEPGLDYAATAPMLAASYRDVTIKLFDTGDGRLLRVLRGHTGRITHVLFNPQSSLLASASYDQTVRIWNATTGELVHAIRQSEGPPHALAFTRDGATLAVGGAGGEIDLWTVGPWVRSGRLQGHRGTVYGLAFDASGRRLASGSGDRTVRLWDLASGIGRTVGEHTARVYDVQFHPGSERIASASADGEARIWDLGRGDYVALRGHYDEVNLLRFSPDGASIATTSDDGSVRLWDAQTGRPRWRAPLLVDGRLISHRTATASSAWEQAVRSQAVAASVELNFAQVCLRDDHGGVEFWDRSTDTLVDRQTTPPSTQVVAFDGGCVRVSNGRISFMRADGTERSFAEPKSASLVAASAGRLFAASEEAIVELGPEGAVLGRYPVSRHVRSIAAWDGSRLLVGYQDGIVERVSSTGAEIVVSRSDTTRSAVVRLARGPGDTFIAGYASGLVALWVPGAPRLRHARLRGAVEHLLVRGDSIVAATDLGDRLLWDLAAFGDRYCDLLRDVWAAVPVVWSKGHVVRRAAPIEHRCAP